MRKMPRKKGEWKVVYYLGVDGVMHPKHVRKLNIRDEILNLLKPKKRREVKT